MAFERLKRLLGRNGSVKQPSARLYSEESRAKARPVAERSGKGSRARKKNRNRKPDSPYTLTPGLQKINIDKIANYIRHNYKKLRTDKLTLLEIADQILAKEIGMPRPAKLKAHMLFEMFTKNGGRVRAGVGTPCHEWQGAYQGDVPVLTTVNAIHGHRLKVDARKYIMENPAKGKRRNFRSKPENICGNTACVNHRHIRMVVNDPFSHQGENHPRSKFTDKDVVRIVKEYNAGATAKELSKKHRMTLTYVEQIMRKEKRTEATDGMTIRGRFGER